MNSRPKLMQQQQKRAKERGEGYLSHQVQISRWYLEYIVIETNYILSRVDK